MKLQKQKPASTLVESASSRSQTMSFALAGFKDNLNKIPSRPVPKRAFILEGHEQDANRTKSKWSQYGDYRITPWHPDSAYKTSQNAYEIEKRRAYAPHGDRGNDNDMAVHQQQTSEVQLQYLWMAIVCFSFLSITQPPDAHFQYILSALVLILASIVILYMSRPRITRSSSPSHFTISILSPFSSVVSLKLAQSIWY